MFPHNKSLEFIFLSLKKIWSVTVAWFVKCNQLTINMFIIYECTIRTYKDLKLVKKDKSCCYNVSQYRHIMYYNCPHVGWEMPRMWTKTPFTLHASWVDRIAVRYQKKLIVNTSKKLSRWINMNYPHVRVSFVFWPIIGQLQVHYRHPLVWSRANHNLHVAEENQNGL